MSGEPVSVERWISYGEAEGLPESVGGLGGWFAEGNTWADLAAASSTESLPYYEALRDDVLASGRFICGDEHHLRCDGVPLFTDGTVGCFSFRAWGDLMAAIASIKHGPKFSYMDFYMSGWSYGVRAGTS